MADDKDKDKQQYLYRPNIEYQDTYESDHLNKGYETIYPDDSGSANESIEVINSVTSTFNELSKVIPLLPAELQTVINGVYKPILDSWANLDKRPYPRIIPDPEKIIWKIPGDESQPGPGSTPGDGTGPTPWDVKFVYPIPPDIPPPTSPKSPTGDYTPNNGGLWDVDPPVVIKTTEVDPTDIIEKEYIKNVADLFGYYVNRLRDIIYHYYSEKVAAIFGKKLDGNGNLINKTANEIAFLLHPIEDNCSDVEQESKHLFDASLAMGETARMKLNFLGNICPVEQTLFHLKNFKTIYLLRHRYSTIDAIDGSNKVDAMSNNILKAMKLSYDQKYDVSFMNLYKYMNSSLDILEDVLNTELAGLKARRTLIEKGGINK